MMNEKINGHGDAFAAADSPKLFADFRTVFFRKIEIAEWTMRVHSRPEHVRIDHENLFAAWTSYLYSLAHRSS
jgi:hypothetical protein